MSTSSRIWTLTAAAVVVVSVGAWCLAVVPPATSPTSQGTETAERCDRQDVVTETDAVHAVQRGQSEDVVEQAVGCLLIPECFRNSDCDAMCGARLGRCVHNDCPIRICRCR